MNKQSKPELPIPTASEPSDAPSKPTISLADIKQALDKASPDEKAAFAEAVGLSKVIGAPKRTKRKVTDEEIKNMALATGGATHPEDWTPTPPEHIYDLGEGAVQAWKNQWLDGKMKNWDRASDLEIAEMVATAHM
jgi:hypothetical protein